MTAFTKSNKVSQNYISSDNIAHFKFKIIFKEVGNVISVPRFDIFSIEDKNEKEAEDCLNEKTFSWQQKVFSAVEIHKYSDLKNSTNDVEKDYNKMITEKSLDPKAHGSKIFSYVSNDNFGEDNTITTNKFSSNYNLEKHFQGLHLKSNQNDSEKPTILLKTEKKSVDKNKAQVEDFKENMFIMIDMNNYDGDPNYLLKREHILFTLIWYPKSRSLIVYPDFNNIYEDPYILETNYDSKRIFHYSIENITNEILDDSKRAEIEIIDKISLSKHEAMSQKMFKIFSMPPKNVLTCYIIFGIISANDFEYDHLYIEYHLELPHGFTTVSDTKGITQVSSKNKKGVAHFGHVFDLNLNYHIDLLEENEGVNIQEPEIYFEIISCDYWGRHRTEGFCFAKIPVTKPGKYVETISTFIPQSSNERIWNMNRYFIGGRHTLNEITWVGMPSGVQSSKLSKCGVKTVPSGKIKIEMNIILQNRYLVSDKNNKDDNEKTLAERVGANLLFKSVNSVLAAYKQAKEKLLTQQQLLNEEEKNEIK